MLLILSARYVSEDIALQFGRLPPSFLPLGDRRLFEVQVEAALGEPCFMTVPADFAISESDTRALKSSGIELLPQPQSMRLPEAIGNALTRVRPEGPLRILYGDTLVKMPPDVLLHPDMVAVQDTTANYPWAFVQHDEAGSISFSDELPKKLDCRRVVCGYYCFEDPDLLATACHEDTIVKALRFYNDRRQLTCVDADSWLDFGHLPLYFRSKKDLLVKRVFNELIYEDHLLIKRSADTAKMRAEAHWFENLPDALKLHAPRYLGRMERGYLAGYGLEYLYAPILSDLAAFGALPLASWLEIIQACFEFVDKCHSIRPPPGAPEASPSFASQFFEDLIVRKTWTRLETYCRKSGISPDTAITLNDVSHPPLNEVVSDLIRNISPTTPDHVRFWHGDLFFGNMFYDFTAQRVLCVDPRGQLASGQLCLWGDLRYDLAKLAHSIIGQYDKLLLGRSRLEESGPFNWHLSVDEQPQQKNIEEIFSRFISESCGIEINELLRITALLFFSMLSLHNDHPQLQRHFLATGLRLAARAKEMQ